MQIEGRPVDRPWVDGAACRGRTELFFDRDREAAAVAVCESCDVLADCRAWVRSHPQKDGVWGGMTTSQREDDRRWRRRITRRDQQRRSEWSTATELQSR